MVLIAVFGIELTTAFVCVPAAGAQIRHGDRIVTVVNHAAPNVRTEPLISPETLLGKVARGTQMKLQAKEGAWYRVTHPSGRTAYLFEDYGEPGIARDLVEITVANARIRESASTAARQVDLASRGTLLPLMWKQSDWFRVKLASGRDGWVRNDLAVLRPLSPPEPESAADEAIEETEPAEKIDHYVQGRAFLNDGDIEQAISSFRQAVAEDPDRSDAHFELALLLKNTGKAEESIEHFRAAGNGLRPRPEARFYLEELLVTADDSSGSEPAEAPAKDEPRWIDRLPDGSTLLLPALAVGSLLFLAAMGFVYRRRRTNASGKPMYRRKKSEAGFDSVLKYAVEKRPLLRAVEEAERKRAEMDLALKQQLEAFQKETNSGTPRLPGLESTEKLLKRVEDLRQTILNQDERVKVYAELVVLQNEKLEALDEEIESLKKLIRLDYADTASRAKKTPPSGKEPS